MHTKPRRAMFIPTGTLDGPDISTLTGARVTRISYLDGSKDEFKSDDWLNPHTQTHCLPKKWTGCTVFQLGDSASHGDTRIGAAAVVATLPDVEPVKQFVTMLDSERDNQFSNVWKSFLSAPDNQTPDPPSPSEPKSVKVPRFRKVRIEDSLGPSPDEIDDKNKSCG